MLVSRPLIAKFLFAASVGFIIAVYFCAYQSGCLFDGKQGYGDLAASEPYSAAVLFFSFGSVIFLCAGLAILQHWSLTQLIPVLVIAVIIGTPVFGFLSFEAAIHGTQQCHPA